MTTASAQATSPASVPPLPRPSQAPIWTIVAASLRTSRWLWLAFIGGIVVVSIFPRLMTTTVGTAPDGPITILPTALLLCWLFSLFISGILSTTVSVPLFTAGGMTRARQTLGWMLADVVDLAVILAISAGVWFLAKAAPWVPFAPAPYVAPMLVVGGLVLLAASGAGKLTGWAFRTMPWWAAIPLLLVPWALVILGMLYLVLVGQNGILADIPDSVPAWPLALGWLALIVIGFLMPRRMEVRKPS